MDSKNKFSEEHIQFLKSVKRKKRTIFITQLAILIVIFLLWELAARLKLVDTFLTSYPSEMWNLFLKLATNGSLFKHIGISVFETVVGFVLGTLLGTLIAILLWWSEFISRVLDPYMVILNALPKTALAPIIIIWVGAGISGIIVTALMVSFVTSFYYTKLIFFII
ncbi:MAG: NitT/TauT family transport system permease protein [Candidatus Petromonas sp.]|nr:NitT/TauT family transport system permease protein [Candidatus Petromonas sp.]